MSEPTAGAKRASRLIWDVIGPARAMLQELEPLLPELIDRATGSPELLNVCKVASAELLTALNYSDHNCRDLRVIMEHVRQRLEAGIARAEGEASNGLVAEYIPVDSKVEQRAEGL